MDDIIILGQQRTGSNLLCYALSFFENYRNINEFYSVDNNTFIYELFFTHEERTQLFEIYNTSDWKKLLYKIHKEPIKSFNILSKIVGNQNKIIKLLDHQFQRNKKLYSLIDISTKFIVLERSNTLEQFVSLKIAEETDTWWNQNTDQIQITVNIDEYQNFCQNKKAYYENLKLQLKDKSYLLINYEEDLAAGISDSLLLKLQKFLNDSSKIIRKDKTKIKKQNTLNCFDKITNYNEIKKYL